MTTPTYPQRGTGITTRQIQRAPHGAIYIWVNANTTYPRNLARRLHRTDIALVSPDWLSNDKWRGSRRPVVLDHAVELSEVQWQIYYVLRDYLISHGVSCG